VAQQTAGRRFDYPTAYNLGFQPKRDEGVTFQQLRQLADGYDLLRLVIETRKQEMELFEWKIQSRDGKTTPASKRLHEFLASPDREHTWHQWQGMLLEELFVTDAPAIYVRKTFGGDPYSLEILDGATITLLLDESGRTPLEGPAYQQVIKGLVTANYERSELLYCPRNVRANKVYGYSPVEQVITTINIALRRQAHQLSYYTEGSVPDLLLSTPEKWQPEHIDEFQKYWNSLFAEGNVKNRRMARFIPHGVVPYNTKEAALKDQYDEWLARIICFTFAISPQALVAQMNKATAEVAQETAQSSGLEPVKNWFKGVMDKIIAEVYGEPGVEFVWVQKDALDPEAQSRIIATYVQLGVIDTNEAREMLGMEARKQQPTLPGPAGAQQPDTDGDIIDAEIVQPGQPAPTAAPNGDPVQDSGMSGIQITSMLNITQSVTSGQLPKESALVMLQVAFPKTDVDKLRGIIEPLTVAPPPTAPAAPQETAPVEPEPKAKPEPVEKSCGCGKGHAPLEKRRLAKVQIDHGRKAIKSITAELQHILEAALERKRDALVDKLLNTVHAFKGELDWAANIPEFRAWYDAVAPLIDDDTLKAVLLQFERAAKSGGTVALNQLRQYMKEQAQQSYDHVVNQVNWKAVEWAKEASNQLVTQIDETTRESLKNLVSNAVERGLSVQELAAEINGAHAFSRERAELIAVTEMAEADVTGNKMGYAASGVVGGLQWLTANEGEDDRTCEDCEKNHLAIVPMGADGMAAQPYPSGARGVPAHPRCICDELPVLKEDL